MPIIAAKDLCKHYRVGERDPGVKGFLRHFFKRKYKTVEAVKGVTFDINPGEMVGFLGPNGAGKTTVLKMLTGLIHPTSGSAVIDGRVPFHRETAFLKSITLVMGQKQQLIWDLPAMDSLRINASVYDIPQPEFEARIKELSNMLSLDGELKKPVRKLSLGERMKAELMAALVHQPTILFLDEPTLGLDVNAQAAVRDFLRDYNRKYNATILLTSHYMADITALCERVLMIHEGNLIYDGSLDGVTQRFAPYREVRLELCEPLEKRELEKYGEVESIEGREVRFIVPQENLTSAMNRMLAELAIVDLAVSDPPIEQIIGKLFKEGMNGEGTEARRDGGTKGGGQGA
ncbi:MAG: ATP-binding cassette domain-containing protein [Phycisphaeraceae bacterium]